jgi:hypothetical protein
MLKKYDPLIVELPLDPEFVTPDGFYMAGYRWGEKGRSVDHQVQRQHPDFVRGVEDGWGDWMQRSGDKIAKNQEQKEAIDNTDKLLQEMLKRYSVELPSIPPAPAAIRSKPLPPVDSGKKMPQNRSLLDKIIGV